MVQVHGSAVVISRLFVLFLLASGTSCGGSFWQREVSTDGLVPLATTSIVRIVDPATGKLVKDTTLVGALLPLEPSWITSVDDPIWVWHDIRGLTSLGLDLTLKRGADEVFQRIGFTLDVGAEVNGVGELKVEVDSSAKLQFKNLWIVELADAGKEENAVLAKFFERFVNSDLAPGRSEHYGFVTSALVAEIDEGKSTGIKVVGKFEKEVVDTVVHLGFAEKVRIKGRGCALGIKGQILTVVGTPERADFEPPFDLPDLADTGIPGMQVRILRQGGTLKPTWTGRSARVYSGRSGDYAPVPNDRVMLADVDSTNLLLGYLDDRRGFVKFIQLSSVGGKVGVTSVRTYEIEIKPLHYRTYEEFATKPEPAVKLRAPVVDEAGWRRALGEGVPFKEFRQHHGDQLLIQPLADEIHAPRVEIVEIYVPRKETSTEYDFVRLIRYDVPRQSGKVFRYRAFASGPTEGQIWGEDGANPIPMIGGPVWYSTVVEEVPIPKGVGTVYVRYGGRSGVIPVDLAGFYGARRAKIDSLRWTVALAPPLGKDVLWVAGQEAPGMPDPGTKGTLPEWVAHALDGALPSREPSAVHVRARLAEANRIFTYDAGRPGRNIVWLRHRADEK